VAKKPTAKSQKKSASVIASSDEAIPDLKFPVPITQYFYNVAAIGRLFLFQISDFARKNAKRRNILQKRYFCFILL